MAEREPQDSLKARTYPDGYVAPGAEPVTYATNHLVGQRLRGPVTLDVVDDQTQLGRWGFVGDEHRDGPAPTQHLVLELERTDDPATDAHDEVATRQLPVVLAPVLPEAPAPARANGGSGTGPNGAPSGNGALRQAPQPEVAVAPPAGNTVNVAGPEAGTETGPAAKRRRRDQWRERIEDRVLSLTGHNLREGDRQAVLEQLRVGFGQTKQEFGEHLDRLADSFEKFASFAVAAALAQMDRLLDRVNPTARIQSWRSPRQVMTDARQSLARQGQAMGQAVSQRFSHVVGTPGRTYRGAKQAGKSMIQDAGHVARHAVPNAYHRGVARWYDRRARLNEQRAKIPVIDSDAVTSAEQRLRAKIDQADQRIAKFDDPRSMSRSDLSRAQRAERQRPGLEQRLAAAEAVRTGQTEQVGSRARAVESGTASFSADAKRHRAQIRPRPSRSNPAVNQPTTTV